MNVLQNLPQRKKLDNMRTPPRLPILHYVKTHVRAGHLSYSVTLYMCKCPLAAAIDPRYSHSGLCACHGSLQCIPRGHAGMRARHGFLAGISYVGSLRKPPLIDVVPDRRRELNFRLYKRIEEFKSKKAYSISERNVIFFSSASCPLSSQAWSRTRFCRRRMRSS